MRWLELSVTADVEAVEAISEILGRVADGTAIHPTALVRDDDDELVARGDPTAPFRVVAHVPDDTEAPSAVDATERALWHLQAFELGAVGTLRTRIVEDADWAEAWKAHYVPQRVGRVVIVPSWIDEPTAAHEVAVTLDPGMAFGTGLHPTTRGCLALLQEVGPMPPTVLDVGCGSGILALAALRLGADRAVAVDTDPLAVAAATQNAERNGLADRLDVRRGSLDARTSERHRLVLANLVAAVLVEIAPRLAEALAADGALIVGGIIDARAAEVEMAMAGAGLRVAGRRVDGEEWVSLRLEHTA